ALEATVRWRCGLALNRAGDFTGYRDNALRLLELARLTGDDAITGYAHRDLGLALGYLGQPEAALPEFAKAVAFAAASGNDDLGERTLTSWSFQLQNSGDIQ